jgi:2-polyprenyl-3-methyl-5-hydroxy-6-metoxy-1,4-benzoquinol methylase
MYAYQDTAPTETHACVWPVIKRLVAEQDWTQKRAFDLGCGSGATGNMLSTLGFDVTGVDPSEQGIKLANEAFPHLRTYLGSAYHDLAREYGTFPLVVSLEVIEHCIEPRRLAKTFFDLLAPDGIGVISAPYHGYLKNLAISIAGGWDFHHSPLWDDGHVKFFSIRTMTLLLEEAGFRRIRFERVGRIPPLAKSMVAIIRK